MSNPSRIASNQLKHSLCRQSIVYFFAHLYHLLGLSKNFCPVALRHTYAPSMLHASPTSFNCTRSCHSNRRHHQQKQQLHNSQHKSCQSKTVAKNCYKAINKMVCTTFFFLSVSFVLFCCCCVLLLLPAMQNYATFLCLIPHWLISKTNATQKQKKNRNKTNKIGSSTRHNTTHMSLYWKTNRNNFQSNFRSCLGATATAASTQRAAH